MRKFQNGFLLSLMAMFSLFSSVFATAQTTVTPASPVSFGNVVGLTASAPVTITLKNSGAGSITLNSVTLPAGSVFAFAGSPPPTNCVTPRTLAAGATCTVTLTVTPTGPTVPLTKLTISSTATNSPEIVVLEATEISPTALSPVSLNLGNVQINTTSAPSTVKLTNNNLGGPLNISSLSLGSGSPYAINAATTSCPYPAPGPLGAGLSCNIGLTLTPTTIGVQSGTLTISDNANNSPQSVPLSGTGVPPPSTLLPAAVNFGNVLVGVQSSVSTVTFTNNEATAVTIGSVSVTPGTPYAIAPSSTCSGATVQPGKTCIVNLTMTPTSAGPQTAGTLTVTSSATNSPQLVSLSGSGYFAITLSATSLNFNPAVVGEATVQTLTLTNNLPSGLAIASITGFTGGYSLSAPNTTCQLAPATLPSGQSCQIGVSLIAPSVGPQNGSMNISYNAAGSPAAVSLNANAVQPVLLSSSSLTFAAQFVGTTSTGQTVTITNEQSGALTISSATFVGADPNDFSISSDTCPTSPATLPAGNFCQLTVTFTPTASGSRTATLDINDDAPGSPQPVSLTGSGSAPVTVLPGSITNFTAPVGSTSAYQNITITNNQTTATLHISSLQLSGDFIQSATSCGATPPYALAPGASCFISVEFNPLIGGILTGQLQVYDDASTSPQVVNLSGSGTSPLTISPSSLSYSAQTVGTSSAAQTITLTNHETKPETFSLVPSGDYKATTNCVTGTIPANSSCLIYVTFSPSSVTPPTRTGTLTIPNSATNGSAAPGTSPVLASLTGAATATNPPAAVSVVSPGAGSSGTNVPVVITGNGWTHFSSSSVISFVETTDNATPCDISVVGGTLNAVSANTIDVTLAVSGNVYGACNISVQTPLTGGGTETALLNSAFIIADPANAHTITSVTPAFGSQGQTLNVAITAVGTSFVQGVTYANFGDGITVNSLTVTDATDAEANITISNTTPIGYRTITMVTDEEYAVSVLSPQGNPIFQIGPNNATLVSLSPNVEPQGFAGPISLTATGTHFLQNATVVSIGGVDVGDVIVTSPTTATVQIAVPAGAPLGLENATVSTGGEIASLANAFSITGATPALVSVVPSSGQQGQALNVVITGNAFTNFVAGQISAEFDGNISSPTVIVNSPNQVTIPITIASDANVGTITANLLSGPAGSVTPFPFAFTVTASGASITSVSPSCVLQGGQATLTVTGLNTIWTQADTTAAFYPAGVPTPSFDEITINSATSASLNVSVPTNSPAGGYAFYMSTGGQIVNATLNVCPATPTLTMSPANGLTPTNNAPNVINVSFTGQFTHWGATTLPVVGGAGVTLTNFVVNSPVSATGTINIAPGTASGLYLVTFTTGGEIVTTNFNVTTTPVGIISINPYHSPTSQTLDVEIVGLNTHFTGGTTTVNFGPFITVNSVTVNTPTDLIANITTSYLDQGVLTPSPSGWQQVYVNTGAEQLLTGFSVDFPGTPTILSVFPSSAAQGSTVDVVITGSLTNWVQGQTEAILGAGVNVSNLVITNPTTATATLSVSPTAPVGGNSVIMITGAEDDSGTGFSVTPSAAEIVSVEPNFTCPQQQVNNIAGFGCSGGGAPTGVPVVAQLQTITLNIVGVGTHWLQGETYLSFGPGVVVDTLTVSSPTTAQAQITVLSSAPVGFASLTSYTAGETVTLQQAIDIEEGSPTLLVISPTSAEQDATFTLQVLGRFTHWQTGVTSAAFNLDFPNDITVNSINVIDSETLTANVTVSPLSYVDFGYPCGHTLTVTTGSEQVGGLPGNFCVTQGGEEITNVYPLQGDQGTTLPVTITGMDTNFIQGITQVSFGDSNFQVGTVTVNSPTSLVASVAISTQATNGFKTVTVSTRGQVASQQYSFSVTPTVPTLNEAIPNQAEQGVQNLNVHLVGQYTHFGPTSTATFGAGITVNSVTLTDATDLVANISIDPLSFTGGRTVTVTTTGVPCAELAGTPYACPANSPPNSTGSEIVSTNAFSIIAGPAIITNVSPNTGNEGQEVVFNITGANTHWQQNFTQFYIAGGGSDLTINSVIINSATSATVDMSISPTANPGTRSIYMQTAGETLTDSGAFVVTGGVPVVTYLSPNSGQPGQSQEEVTINGLYTLWTQAATTVSFGPGITITSLTVDDNTHITAVINIDPAAQTGYRTVFVQTGTQALTSAFLVQPPPPPPTPYLWYESPSSGIPGQTLTINFAGINTEWNPGPGGACSQSGTTITGFNADVTVNCFQITGPTTATANVTISPTATASQSTLTLTTTGTASYGTEVDFGSFTVVVAQPVLTIVDPGSGLQGGQNITVNILGQFTAFDSTTTFQFGPPGCAPVDECITVNGPPTILGPGIATQSISIGNLAPLGGYAVVANTPDATTASQQVVGGAYFSVTPSLALISAITPNTAAQGQTVQVEMTGQNTNWDNSTVFSFGAGIVVQSTQVNNLTDATLTLVIPPLAPEGPTSASATTGGEIARITNGFVVQAGTPYLLSSGPTTLPQQSTAVFTILSQATTWTQANPPVVSFGPGVILTNTIVTSPTSLTVDGYIQPTTNVGERNLTVTTGTQILGLNNVLYVSPGPAVINSVTANMAGQGVNLPAVQIVGTNTNWVQGVTQLTFPGVLINSYTVVSPTLITANITVSDYATAGQVNVTATTGGEVATGINVFTITQTQAELLAVVPTSEVQGWTGNINLTGQFTHFNTAAGCAPNCSVVSFGSGITVNSVTASSQTQLQANITVQPTTTLGYRNVSVTTGTESVQLNNAFQVTVGPAAILSLTPNSGAQGNNYTVNVVGSQSNFAQGVTTASFGGGIQVTGVTVTDLLHASVNITIPTSTSLGAYNVTLTTNGETATILGGFTVTSGSPQLSAVNPPTSTQGTTNLNVTLTGLFTHFNTVAGCAPNCSQASFSGTGITVNSTIASSATSAVANITISQTATLSSRNVTVTTGAETASITGGFTVLAGVPAILNANPANGQAGATLNVTINSQFTTFTVASTASFGDGIVTNFTTYVNPTQVIANITIPTNATVENTYVSVTTGAQVLTLDNAFAVTPGTPVITQISPNFGNPGQSNLTLTITGQYTTWTSASTVTIGTLADGISVGGATPGSPGPVVSATPTSVTVSISIASGAPVGPAEVTVTTGAVSQQVPAGFTVQAATIPAPSLISLSPGPNTNVNNVPINTSFVGVFSQPMNRTTINTSTVLLYLVSNPNQGYVPVSGTVSVDASGRIMTFTPTSLLAVNSEYYLLLTNSIKDATGNTFPQYGYVSFYTVDSASVTPPVVIAANPPANFTNVGTNVIPQLQFSVDMDQQTGAGVTLMQAGNPVTGVYSWNSSANGSPAWGPGTILSFTPTTPLTPNTTYTLAWGAPLTDTATNPVVPGSFTFTTGSGADTVTNNSGSNFTNNLTNVGINFAPRMNYSKPVNPIDINTGTLFLYNSDSGKYINGTVTVAPNGMSATFTPTYPLLPDTYYRFYQAGGSYDMDGNTLNGVNDYFTTGAGSDTTPPLVASISPANNATAVPINAQVVAVFSAPVDPDTIANAITVTPSGGSAIAGTTTLASDMVTLTFVPANTLEGGTTYTVQLSGYADPAGNAGTPFSSTFTTSASIAPINVSTGFNAGGNLITVNNTPDANWTYVPVANLPGQGGEPLYTFTAGVHATGPAAPLEVVGSGDTGFYSGWPVNGPTSDWININPNSTTNNTLGVYSTTFNITGPTVPANLCLVGSVGIDDNGELAINGTAITSNISAISSLAALNVPVSSYLVVGSNTLSLGWGTTDNNDEAFRLGASIQTCGASYTGGLTLTSATPTNGASNVSTNTTITLTFNHVLDPATVNATTLPVMVGYNSNQELTGSYQVNGNVVTYTPDSPFPTNTTIYVGTCNGPIDLAGDSAGGCYTALTDFTTGSTATPAGSPFQVIASSPANNATNVGLRAPVAVTFNRSVDLSTINASDFAMFQGDGQSPWCSGGSYSHSQDNSTIIFNCGVLPSSSIMTEFLSSGLTDWQGNGLTPFTNQFTTTYYDTNTHGSLVSVRPATGATGVNASLPIVLYFNLPINPSTASSGIQVAENNAAISGTVQVLDNGYTLEFTPSSPWTAGALIQWWTTSALTDTVYNATINTTSGYFFAAASTATLVPAVQVASPSDDATAAINSIVDLQFNTPLNPSTVNSTNIYLYDGNTGLHVAGTYSMPQPNEVRIVPSANFGSARYIYVYLTPGLESTTSVPFGSTTYVTYFYTGNPVDTTLPVVVSAVPYNGASNVGVNVEPGVVFNKSIDPVSLNANTFQVLNSGTPLAGSFMFSDNDTKIQFVPNAPLPASTSLTMSLNGVLDQVGNPVIFASSFVTGAAPDLTAPTVVWTSIPSNGSIPTNSMITVMFSESMDVTTFSTGASGDIYIYDSLLGVRVPATLSWNSTQTVAYLVPSSPLSAGREYYFYANTGMDLAGNELSGIEITFYAELTSATSAPTVIAFNPLSGSSGLGTNAIVEAEFSAPIDPNTVNGVTLKAGGNPVTTSPVLSVGNTVLQLVPAVPLQPNTTYTMTIAGVKDPAGNAVAPVANSFTTGATYDDTPPTVVSTDPVSCSNNPAGCPAYGINVTPKILFNKPLNPVGVNGTYFALELNDTGQIIPATISLSANGREVTFTPQVPLLPNTEYRFSNINGGGSVDEDGNYANLSWYYFYTGSGTVTTGPTVAVTPANAATGIPLNAQVIANISTPIDPTTWTQNSIQVLNGATPIAGTVSLPNIQELVFAPSSPLLAGTTYTVNVSGFTDASGNPVVPSSTTFTTGTSASGGGLTLVSSSFPYTTPYATNVSTSAQIVLVFSQILDPTTVNSSTMEVMDTWNSNQPLAATYAVNGNTVTITPVVQWPANTNVTVGECGGPSDILGDVFYSGNCWEQELAYFTTTSATPDTTPLTVVSVNPPNGATNVRHDIPVTVTFNEAIKPASAGGDNSLLYAGQDLQTNGSTTVSADGRTLTVYNSALDNGTDYTLELPASGITDWSGNSLATTFISTFTTANNPPNGGSQVQSTLPANNASGVPTNTLLTLYLNRPVNVSTLAGNINVTVNGTVQSGTLTSIAGGYEVQYTPSTAFPNSATIQWFFSNVQDIYGNVFGSDSGYFYTAAAPPNPSTAQPTIVAISPAYAGSTTMPTNGEIDIEYSQPIDATTLTGNVYFNTPTTPATVTLVSPTVVRLTPNSAMTPGATFYGVCTNSNVKGTNGVAAQASCYATYFYTASGPDTTAGTVTIGPPNGSVNVGTNGNIRLQFSKPVDRTSINATSVQITTSGNPIPGTFSYNYTSDDLVGVNFTPLNPLPASSPIQVSVNGLLDYAGNNFQSATSNFTTAATPDYSTPTVTFDFNGGTTGIGTNASFTCLYSEPMDPSSIASAGTFVWSYSANARVPVTYSFASDLMAVTMTPTSPLATNSEFYYSCQDAYNLTGTAQSGTTSSFYTGSGTVTTGPTLVAANPPNGYTNVPLNTNQGPWLNSSLGLLFSEPVAQNSLSGITLTPNGGSPLPIGFQMEDGDFMVWVQLPSALLPNTQYTYNVTGVTDLNGNPMTPATSTFTTGSSYDYTTPVATSATPANGVTGVNDATPGLSVTFNEPMDPVLMDSSHIYLRTHNTQTLVPTTWTQSADYKTVFLTPAAPLAAATIYDLVTASPEGWYLYSIAGNYYSQTGVVTTFTTQ